MVDIQFILDPAKAFDYVMKYLFKNETDGASSKQALLKLVKKAAESGASSNTLANWLLNACTTERGLGSWEAATIALGLELYSFSRPLRRLSTSQGVTVAVDDPMQEGAGDANAGAEGPAGAPLESHYTKYANRQFHHDKSWRWCWTWCDTSCANVHTTPACVSLCWNPTCQLLDPNEGGGRLSRLFEARGLVRAAPNA